MDKELEIVVKRVISYSWDPSFFKYSFLTKQEKSLISESEFVALIEWMNQGAEIEIKNPVLGEGSCNPPGGYRIIDRHGNGPGPCQADIEFKWELDDYYDPDEYTEKPNEVWVLVAFDKRSGIAADSLGGIADPSRDEALRFQEEMLASFPKEPLQLCSTKGWF